MHGCVCPTQNLHQFQRPFPHCLTFWNSFLTFLLVFSNLERAQTMHWYLHIIVSHRTTPSCRCWIVCNPHSIPNQMTPFWQLCLQFTLSLQISSQDALNPEIGKIFGFLFMPALTVKFTCQLLPLCKLCIPLDIHEELYFYFSGRTKYLNAL